MQQSHLKNITGWSIILITIFSVFLITQFSGFNLPFLLFLIFEIIVVIRYRKIFSPGMITAGRLMLGLLFLFSGFSKGVDPLGTAYRVEDYFIAYGVDWMMPSALFFSFVLNAAELVLGGLLILNIKPKLISWLVLVMMVFFTLTTLNDAISNPVPDCGCFGDALIMTNWQTFYKNLVISVLVFIVFLNRDKLKNSYHNSTEWTIGFALIAVFIGFQYLNVINLPMMDFRAWKVGNRLFPETPQPVKYYLIYKHKTTGEVKEYLSPEYPYDDPEWVENWEFVSQRVEDPNRIQGMDLAIIDFGGEDVTNTFLKNPDYHFFAVAWDLGSTDTEAFQEIVQLYENAEENGYSFIVITATLPSKIQYFLEREKLTFDIPFYNADDIALKTMIRANPGLIMIKNGKVIDKWHHNFLPDWEELEENYLRSEGQD
jgi:uncharacterized membrane protein YphA (DoxX/SURF4 family)